MPHVHQVATPRHQLARWVGRRVVEVDGTRIGTVLAVYADQPGPAWALVRDRRLGGWRRAVPLDAAHSSEVGIVVPYTRGVVRGAPVIERGEPSPQERQRLLAYYDKVDADASPGVADERAPGDPSAPELATMAQAVAEARHQSQKLALYRARMYRGDATSQRRLRELERAVTGAEANLRRLRERAAADPPAAPR